jgi:hypothetical protein
MSNQAQEDLSPRSIFLRAVIAPICAAALFAAVVAISQEAKSTGQIGTPPAASANVLPPLVISSEALEPNLNGVLATGEGGALIVLTDGGL